MNFIKNWRLDPDCVWLDLRKEAYKQKRIQHIPIWGVSFGAQAETSFVAGVAGPLVGGEIILLKMNSKTLMVGFVTFKGGTAGLGSPFSASVFESLLLGDCREGIQSYLGWFIGKASPGLVRGKMTSYANPGRYIPFTSRFEGCSAISYAGGAVGSVGGIYATYYRQWGTAILLQGNEVSEFIQWMDGI